MDKARWRSGSGNEDAITEMKGPKEAAAPQRSRGLVPSLRARSKCVSVGIGRQAWLRLPGAPQCGNSETSLVHLAPPPAVNRNLTGSP